MAIRALIFFHCFLFTYKSFSAACCGGGSSLPTLITGDYKGQVTVSSSNSGITHDSNSDGEINKRDANNHEINETVAISPSVLISPYWQIGMTLPYRFNTHRTENYHESSNGLSDLKAQIAYEFLPELSYSKWKPRGFFFFEQTFPSSKSSFEADKPLASDSLGNGFYTSSIGTAFIKSIRSFDFMLMAELHYGLPRTFNKTKVTPSPGGSFLLSLGHNPNFGNFRIGTTFLYSQEGSKEIKTETETSKSSTSYYTEAGLNFSYLYDDKSFQFGYRDQSLFGYAQNTTLAKSISFTFVNFYPL